MVAPASRNCVAIRLPSTMLSKVRSRKLRQRVRDFGSSAPAADFFGISLSVMVCLQPRGHGRPGWNRVVATLRRRRGQHYGQ